MPPPNQAENNASISDADKERFAKEQEVFEATLAQLNGDDRVIDLTLKDIAHPDGDEGVIKHGDQYGVSGKSTFKCFNKRIEAIYPKIYADVKRERKRIKALNLSKGEERKQLAAIGENSIEVHNVNVVQELEDIWAICKDPISLKTKFGGAVNTIAYSKGFNNSKLKSNPRLKANYQSLQYAQIYFSILKIFKDNRDENIDFLNDSGERKSKFVPVSPLFAMENIRIMCMEFSMLDAQMRMLKSWQSNGLINEKKFREYRISLVLCYEKVKRYYGISDFSKDEIKKHGENYKKLFKSSPFQTRAIEEFGFDEKDIKAAKADISGGVLYGDDYYDKEKAKTYEQVNYTSHRKEKKRWRNWRFPWEKSSSKDVFSTEYNKLEDLSSDNSESIQNKIVRKILACIDKENRCLNENICTLSLKEGEISYLLKRERGEYIGIGKIVDNLLKSINSKDSVERFTSRLRRQDYLVRKLDELGNINQNLKRKLMQCIDKKSRVFTKEIRNVEFTKEEIALLASDKKVSSVFDEILSMSAPGAQRERFLLCLHRSSALLKLARIGGSGAEKLVACVDREDFQLIEKDFFELVLSRRELDQLGYEETRQALDDVLQLLDGEGSVDDLIQTLTTISHTNRPLDRTEYATNLGSTLANKCRDLWNWCLSKTKKSPGVDDKNVTVTDRDLLVQRQQQVLGEFEKYGGSGAKEIIACFDKDDWQKSCENKQTLALTDQALQVLSTDKAKKACGEFLRLCGWESVEDVDVDNFIQEIKNVSLTNRNKLAELEESLGLTASARSAVHKIIQCMSKNASQCKNNLSELALTEQELNALKQPAAKTVLNESLQVLAMNVNVDGFIAQVEQNALANRSRQYGAHDKGYWCYASQWGHKRQNSIIHNHVIIEDYYAPVSSPS